MSYIRIFIYSKYIINKNGGNNRARPNALHLTARLPNASHSVPTSPLPPKNSPLDCFLNAETFTGSRQYQNTFHIYLKCIIKQNGGNNRARTYDPLLVRQMLSQLSYAPTLFGKKKHSTLKCFFYGGDTQNRTGASGCCRPTPYRLAMSPCLTSQRELLYHNLF